jgi:hypothetical protein
LITFDLIDCGRRKESGEMSGIAFEYKCRRCDKIERNPHTSEAVGSAMLIAAINNKPFPIAGGPLEMVSVHTCSDKGAGVTDLIGYSLSSNVP